MKRQKLPVFSTSFNIFVAICIRFLIQPAKWLWWSFRCMTIPYLYFPSIVLLSFIVFFFMCILFVVFFSFFYSCVDKSFHFVWTIVIMCLVWVWLWVCIVNHCYSLIEKWKLFELNWRTPSALQKKKTNTVATAAVMSNHLYTESHEREKKPTERTKRQRERENEQRKKNTRNIVWCCKIRVSFPFSCEMF